MKNVFIVHFLISHSGENVINHPHVGHQSTSSGAWKLLDGCQLVPWPCTGRSPCQAARDGAHKVCQGSSSILWNRETAEVSMFSLTLSKQALPVRFKQLGSVVGSLTSTAPTSNNFWGQTSMQMSSRLESPLFPLTLPFISKTRSFKTGPFLIWLLRLNCSVFPLPQHKIARIYSYLPLFPI